MIDKFHLFQIVAGIGWEPEISFKELVEDMCIYGQ